MARHASLICLAGLAIALPGRAAAEQPRGRLGIPLLLAQYWYTGRVTLTDPARSTDLGLEAHTVRLSAMAGHRFRATRTIVGAALGYDLTVSAARRGVAAWREQSYHAPSLRLTLLQGVAERWRLLAFGRVSLASDMRGVVLGDLLVSAGAGVRYTVSPAVSLVLGAMLTNNFGGPLPLPLITVDYRRGPWRLRLRVPKGAEAWYALGRGRWLELGLEVGVLNLRYGLHAADRIGARYYWLNVTAGPSARLYLFRGAYLQLAGGYNARVLEVSPREGASGGASTYRGQIWRGGFTTISAGYML